ncbi:RT0821/Lpp0805 family surface protein [Aminobacter anthyllidis]|uniref:RT0821/Lpp0805 family surface protein n=1 Tax=Aminobacter anthyllidis TaxID=1035067 RepID=UPI001FE8226D|nr:RT0821/Lpp0805 family surface protein [Aminobacter anthyllidis]MDH4985926.1 RT0821/Lpp0805 family surface protein [Aminobacter anthyllidis]
MSRFAQAFEGHCLPQIGSRSLKLVLLLSLTTISACGAGGFSLEKAEVDRSLVTSKVPDDVNRTSDANRLSDETTIRNAVSSADVAELKGQAIPWANAETGSRGAITALVESNERGVLCREFAVSRESFDGVSLFKGEVCAAGSGAWQMLSFQPA